mmetsp:Transcript_135802/g.433333  ORF Transcript_135802/g.433333 Transcript_135802/m.433333 type:complete len:259 (-) Transcript_135802:7-783(-)
MHEEHGDAGRPGGVQRAVENVVADVTTCIRGDGRANAPVVQLAQDLGQSQGREKLGLCLGHHRLPAWLPALDIWDAEVRDVKSSALQVHLLAHRGDPQVYHRAGLSGSVGARGSAHEALENGLHLAPAGRGRHLQGIQALEPDVGGRKLLQQLGGDALGGLASGDELPEGTADDGGRVVLNTSERTEAGQVYRHRPPRHLLAVHCLPGLAAQPLAAIRRGCEDAAKTEFGSAATSCVRHGWRSPKKGKPVLWPRAARA